jgi:hypothetical protein
MLDWGWNVKHRELTTSGWCQTFQLMQWIIHTNGVQDSKLEIHGLDGEPLHDILECRLFIDDGNEGSLNYVIIEFPTRDP